MNQSERDWIKHQLALAAEHAKNAADLLGANEVPGLRDITKAHMEIIKSRRAGRLARRAIEDHMERASGGLKRFPAL